MGHAAYLAAEGGSFNGFDITGIGFNKVEQIFYRAETTYFTSGETFNEAYTHLVQAASDLYGTDDVGQVVKALRAAEINMPRSFNGDFNADGYVDSADYVLWRKGLGTDYSQGLFDIWRAHFSESAPAEGTTVTYYIPEPSVAYLVLFAVVPLLCACPCRGLFVRYACSS